MSAFICGKKCFEYILSAMYDHWELCAESIVKLGDENEYDDSRQESCRRKEKLNWFGNELLKMNIKSVNCRYHDHTKYNPLQFDIKRLDDYTKQQYQKELACAIKQIRCLMYQSCELDNYHKDWRWRALETVLNILSNAFVESTHEYCTCEEWGF